MLNLVRMEMCSNFIAHGNMTQISLHIRVKTEKLLGIKLELFKSIQPNSTIFKLQANHSK